MVKRGSDSGKSGKRVTIPGKKAASAASAARRAAKKASPKPSSNLSVDNIGKGKRVSGEVKHVKPVAAPQPVSAPQPTQERKTSAGAARRIYQAIAPRREVQAAASSRTAPPAEPPDEQTIINQEVYVDNSGGQTRSSCCCCLPGAIVAVGLGLLLAWVVGAFVA